MAEAHRGIRELRKAIERDPTDVNALTELAVLYSRGGNRADAVSLLEKAICLSPDNMLPHLTLGKLYKTAGDLDAAQACYLKCESLNRQSPLPPLLLGRLYLEGLRDAQMAARCFKEALSRQPMLRETHEQLALCMVDTDSVSNLIANVRGSSEEINFKRLQLLGLQFAYCRFGRYQDAVECNEELISRYPPCAEAIRNLGSIAFSLRKDLDGMKFYEQAVSAEPDNLEHRTFYVRAWVRVGDLSRARAEFQHCLPLLGDNPFKNRLWRGESVKGKQIVLHASGGYGDAIQFIRFGKYLRDEGASIIAKCHKALVNLFRGIPWIDDAICFEDSSPSADFESHCDGVLLLREIGFDHLSTHIPYIFPSATSKAAYANSHSESVIGLQWRGRGTDSQNPYHSKHIPLSQFAQFREICKARFISLVPKDDVSMEDQIELRHLFGEEALGSSLESFDDLATAVASLHLVISVDTAVAHLAGAMGKTVHVLLPFSPVDGWRWFADQQKTPWYPTMTLFRPDSPGEWNTAIDAITRQICIEP